MSSSTAVHVLQLKLGRAFRVEITETADVVYINFGGDKPRASDEAAITEFLWPIFCKYEDDDRPIDLDGAHTRGGAGRLHTLGRTDDAVVLGIVRIPRPRANA